MSTMVATEPEVMPKAEVTPEELLAMPDGGHYELIDGELKERRVSFLSNLVTAEVTGILREHCRSHNLGWILAAELGYRCFPWKPRRIRRADVSFFRADRVSKEQLSEGFCSIAPDLAVEVVSPNDLAEELLEKVEEYLRAGVKLVWIVYPNVKAVQVFRADGSVSGFRASAELSGEDVIPGFRCRVDAFFPMSAPAEKPSPQANGPEAASS
jgi:Uma2 family endonuclease